jgi:hypothetical protein
VALKGLLENGFCHRFQAETMECAHKIKPTLKEGQNTKLFTTPIWLLYCRTSVSEVAAYWLIATSFTLRS